MHARKNRVPSSKKNVKKSKDHFQITYGTRNKKIKAYEAVSRVAVREAAYAYK